MIQVENEQNTGNYCFSSVQPRDYVYWGTYTTYKGGDDLATFVHIGLPKTGSTFLQRVLFPEMSELGFEIRTTDVRSTWPSQLSWVYLTDLPILAKRRSTWGVATRLSEQIRFGLAGEWKKPLRGNQENSPQLVSAEGLCGWSLNPSVNAGLHARQLSQSIPHARVIAVFRRHLDWAESVYHQVIVEEQRYFHTPSRPIVPLQKVFGSSSNALVKLQDVKLAQVASEFCARFGRQNCLFLNFDDLISEPDWFLHRILQFCEIPESNRRQKVVDRVKKASPERSRNQTGLTGSTKWSERERAELQRFVEPDWRELELKFLEQMRRRDFQSKE